MRKNKIKNKKTKQTQTKSQLLFELVWWVITKLAVIFLENQSNGFCSKGESESQQQPYLDSWDWWIPQSFSLYIAGACQSFVAKLGKKGNLSRGVRRLPVRTRWFWGAPLVTTLKIKALVLSKKVWKSRGFWLASPGPTGSASHTHTWYCEMYALVCLPPNMCAVLYP